ncbi:unnamed protein product (macronuclear) [Paramecium tetraurelia]|uniref:SET domain-containing protein n=1 Tax=Paramecium tetraurelia TaxID=5888 RepID=A0CKA5_PARTE|nr:uncharacterized protein GSPATT00000935001 [Paramecium tetraurelia]CAK71222.1 unnamed protein product [Paramecium tetraurelia]|eukprot:XP_001438619.1 hypothetical protein (macronuclear) [Paramecium tetraurelia strain d4-2]
MYHIECVMSRCFGWDLKSTCLVPIADFLNHSNKACTHYMVHSALEKGSFSKSEEQANFQTQYVIKRNNMNMNILGIEADNEIQKWEDEKIKFILENKQCLRDQNAQNGPKEYQPQLQPKILFFEDQLYVGINLKQISKNLLLQLSNQKEKQELDQQLQLQYYSLQFN